MLELCATVVEQSSCLSFLPCLYSNILCSKVLCVHPYLDRHLIFTEMFVPLLSVVSLGSEAEKLENTNFNHFVTIKSSRQLSS